MKRFVIYAVVVTLCWFTNPLKSFSQDVTWEINNPYPLTETKWKQLMSDNEEIINQYEGQELSKLPERKRDEYLIALAKRAILTFGPAYYREYKQPIIREGVFPPTEYKEHWSRAEQSYYEVLFPYDISKELFTCTFVARVFIMKADASLAFLIIGSNENAFMFTSKENETKRRLSYLEDRSKCLPYRSIPFSDTSYREEILQKVRQELEKYHLQE